MFSPCPTSHAINTGTAALLDAKIRSTFGTSRDCSDFARYICIYMYIYIYISIPGIRTDKFHPPCIHSAPRPLVRPNLVIEGLSCRPRPVTDIQRGPDLPLLCRTCHHSREVFLSACLDWHRLVRLHGLRDFLVTSFVSEDCHGKLHLLTLVRKGGRINDELGKGLPAASSIISADASGTSQAATSSKQQTTGLLPTQRSSPASRASHDQNPSRKIRTNRGQANALETRRLRAGNILGLRSCGIWAA